ncbi:ArdC family protein [Dactylosporangium sp. NPDC051541]|uniref:ArdC family protein n=1 Tax=Dactylosporangium sp. NPDC051541 TaxID=3363977 RepID=UPI0037B90469
MATQHSPAGDTATPATEQPGGEHAELLVKIQADFDARLAAMAAQPARWVEFIDHAATLGARYSLGNQILLLVQAEERGITPRHFLPFGRRDHSTGWRAHGRWVRTGQRAFKVWAPITRRPGDEQVTAWEAAGRTVARDAAGRPAVQVVGFRLVNVFELSQTDGEPFEVPTVAVRRRVRSHGSAPVRLDGDDPTGAFDDLVRLITAAGYRFELRPPRSGYLGAADGVTVRRPGLQVVQVRDDVEASQRTKTAMHELAHIRCGHLDTTAGARLHRGRGETEAESVAHIVLRAMGLDSAEFSDAYVFDWAGGDLDLVRSCADAVLRIARQILADLTPAGLAGDTGPGLVAAAERVTG